MSGFSGDSDRKESACNVGDLGSIPEDPWEKEMATHSSILAWRIPCTEEPGGLWSMGLQSWTQLSDQHFCFTFTECFTCVSSFDSWQLHELEIIIPILQVKKPRHKDMKELAHFSMLSKAGLSIQIQTTGFSKLVL